MQAAPCRAARWFRWAAALLILANMLWFGRDAFSAVFSGDDMMNMFGYWERGPWRLFGSQFLLFGPEYRPMGGLFYMPLFYIAGLRPLPYHLAAFALMAVNAWLVYRVTTRLGGSAAAAWLAAFLSSYHAGMAELYYQTGVIYDILCFLFFFWAFDYYLVFRTRNEPAGPRRLLALGAIYACALNSKEMAVTLPVMLLAYELSFHAPACWRPDALLHWAANSGRAIWVTGAITAAFIYGKTHGPDAIANTPGYRGIYSAAQFVKANRLYLAQHLLNRVHFSTAALFLLWAGMLGVALLLKRRGLRVLWVWAVATPLPVVFVQRSHSCVYIPFAGLAMFAAIALTVAASRLDVVLRVRPRRLEAAAALLLAVLFARGNAIHKRGLQTYIRQDGYLVWSVIEQFNALKPRIEPHSNVLLLDSPFPDWDLQFIAALWINDPTVLVWLDRPGHSVPASELSQFRHVFRFQQGRLIELPPAAPPTGT